MVDMPLPFLVCGVACTAACVETGSRPGSSGASSVTFTRPVLPQPGPPRSVDRSVQGHRKGRADERVKANETNPAACSRHTLEPHEHHPCRSVLAGERGRFPWGRTSELTPFDQPVNAGCATTTTSMRPSWPASLPKHSPPTDVDCESRGPQWKQSRRAYCARTW
jgi:hypothetical protein